MRDARRALLALGLVGCQPLAIPTDSACDAEPPVTVRITTHLCDEQQILGGEGRRVDVQLANGLFSAILRHPQDALTLAGVGGGTLIDAAPWGKRDRLHEVAPLVGGGWLDVKEWSLDPDGITLAGPVVSLPDQPATDEGAWREARWRIEPDSPWLHVEGADGLWLHPAGGADLLDGQVVAGDVVYGHDGVVAQDLGGALRIDGATRLLVAPLTEAWGWLAEDPVPIRGVAKHASAVLLRRDGRVVGRIPVAQTGAFSAVVDRSVEGLQAIGPARAPSPVVAPGEDVHLELGGEARVTVRPSFDGRPRTLAVQWVSSDGRAGRSTLPLDGGELGLGEGVFDLTFSAGPAWRSTETRVELRPGDHTELGVRMRPSFDPGDRVLATLSWRSDRSRTWRGSDGSAAWQASGEGFDYAVFSPEDEVSSVNSAASGFPSLVARGGSMFTDRDGAWRIVSWPWSASSAENAHGVPNVAGVGPEDALGLAWGGPARNRFTVVDQAWLEAVGLPHEVAPRPTHVRLGSPGTAGQDWWRWFDWLDAGALLIPVGPYNWVEVEDPDLYGAVDVERGLLFGHLSASTTGALLTLSVGPHGPGDVVQPEALPGFPSAEPPGSHVIPHRYRRVELALHGEPLDHLAIVGEGGAVWAQTDATRWAGRVELDTRWIVGLAWSDEGDDWAVTGPVWIDPP